MLFQRLIVCLEESLYIHNIRDMKVLHTIRETPPNKSGLCALSTDSDNCYLAYPGHSSVGELQVSQIQTILKLCEKKNCTEKMGANILGRVSEGRKISSKCSSKR